MYKHGMIVIQLSILLFLLAWQPAAFGAPGRNDGLDVLHHAPQEAHLGSFELSGDGHLTSVGGINSESVAGELHNLSQAVSLSDDTGQFVIRHVGFLHDRSEGAVVLDVYRFGDDITVVQHYVSPQGDVFLFEDSTFSLGPVETVSGQCDYFVNACATIAYRAEQTKYTCKVLGPVIGPICQGTLSVLSGLADVACSAMNAFCGTLVDRFENLCSQVPEACNCEIDPKDPQCLIGQQAISPQSPYRFHATRHGLLA